MDGAMDPVVVVGAGVSGLGAAWALHEEGITVLLLEASPEVGGVVRSRTLDDGTVLDLGPQTLSTRDPELLEVLSRVGLAERTLEGDPAGARRYVVHEGAPVALPTDPLSLVATPLLSTRAKLRLLSEPFRRAPRPSNSRPGTAGGGTGEADEAGSGGDSGAPGGPALASSGGESVAEFARRRLGPEVEARLVDPFVSGVFAGDPEEVSVAAALPELLAMERDHGSLVRGGLRRLRTSRRARREAREGGEDPAPKGSRILSFDEGLQGWPRAVARSLGPERVRTGVQVERLQRSPDSETGWELRVKSASNGAEESLRARSVILAIPAHSSGRLLQEMVPEAARALAQIPYAPVSLVHLIFSREQVDHPLDGFGVLAPSGEEREILGSLWPDSIFPGRNRTDRAVTVNFIGGARTPDRARAGDERLVDMATREVRNLLGVRGEPIMARVTRWPHAIPQYTRGHLARVAAVARAEEEYPGLQLTGSWREGVSLGGAWGQGVKAGRNVAGRFTGRTGVRS